MSSTAAARKVAGAGAVALGWASLWAWAESARTGGTGPLLHQAARMGLCGSSGMGGAFDRALLPAHAAVAASSLLGAAPCLLQMGLVLAAVWCGVTPAALGAVPVASRLRRAAAAAPSFAAGYAAVFVPVALLMVAGATAVHPHARLLRAAGGLVLVGLAGHRLGWLRKKGEPRTRGDSPHCGGPAPHLAGRAGRGGLRPFHAGLAYALYCATCCGPYLAAAGLIAASAPGLGSALAVAGLHAGFALLPLLLALAPHPWQWVARAGRHLGTLAGGSALAMGVAGLWLLLSAATGSGGG